MDSNRLRERITKLLAMASDDRGNEHESEVAMRMAQRLMTEHNIDVADLEASSGKKTIYVWGEAYEYVGTDGNKIISRCPQWIGFLSWGVSKFTDCRSQWVRRSNGLCIKFMGEELDVAYASWLFGALRDYGYAESQAVAGRYRETFRKAYAIRLQGRMAELRAERDVAMKEASSGTALVVVATKLALRDEQFGAGKNKFTRPKMASQGFNEGRAAADRANLNRPLNSNNHRQLA